jgi:hypothetical protein
MRKLIEIFAVIALLNVSGGLALADGPAVSAQPDVRPDAQSSTVGGSALADGGNAGPATVATSEPVSATSSNTTGPGTPSHGSASATGPGTTASAPLNASSSQPDPSAPDGSAPTPTTYGPSADADASRTNASADDSGIRANAIATGTGSFAGSLAGFGSAEDPTFASTCSNAEATPGVPTNLSVGTSCGTQPSSASEDFSANDTDGNGAAGTPSASTCLVANASAGPTPTTDLDSACAGQTEASSPTDSSAADAVANANSAGNAKGLLGINSLPSSATAPESLALLGMTLGGAGLALLRRSRRKN